jgi:hypothetical protein
MSTEKNFGNGKNVGDLSLEIKKDIVDVLKISLKHNFPLGKFVHGKYMEQEIAQWVVTPKREIERYIFSGKHSLSLSFGYPLWLDELIELSDGKKVNLSTKLRKITDWHTLFFSEKHANQIIKMYPPSNLENGSFEKPFRPPIFLGQSEYVDCDISKGEKDDCRSESTFQGTA